jgi:hypothetical protein
MKLNIFKVMKYLTNKNLYQIINFNLMKEHEHVEIDNQKYIFKVKCNYL